MKNNDVKTTKNVVYLKQELKECYASKDAIRAAIIDWRLCQMGY